MQDEDDIPEEQVNDHLLLIKGEPTMGKTMALRNLRGGKRVMFMNTEGKRPPFKHDYDYYKISNPLDVESGLEHALENERDYDCVVVDSTTFMMDKYESQLVIPHAGTKAGQAAWGGFGQFYKKVMTLTGQLNIPVIHTAHVEDVFDEKEAITKTRVRAKGSLRGQIESYYNHVFSVKRVRIKALEKTDCSFLTITDRERSQDFKHVIQVRVTKDNIGETLRGPIDLYPDDVVYVESDAQAILDHFKAYYG